MRREWLTAKNVLVGWMLGFIILSSTYAFASLTSSSGSSGGFPTPKMIEGSREDEDFHRAITAYRFWYPTVSAEAIFKGNRDVGIKDNDSFAIKFVQPHHRGFALNSDTPYGTGVLDLTEDPMIIDMPAGPFVAYVNDHHQRWIIDMGMTGADRGRGGKYLLLPPDYKGKIPTGDFIVGKSSSFKVLVTIRAIPMKGDENEAMNDLRAVKIYPLPLESNPQPIKFVDVSQIQMDTTPIRWETSLQFWQVLHQVINEEPIDEDFLPMYGLLVTLGIEKGKPFEPDQRMKVLLEKAAKIGNEQMRVAGFANDELNRLAWPDRKWEWIGLSSLPANFKTLADMDSQACDRWFIQAIGASPTIFQRTPGAGALYWVDLRDKAGVYLEGGNSYKLTIPQPIPANLLWSLTVYDATTRSQIQTSQNKAALRSVEFKDIPILQPIELYFGPNPPAGKSHLWIKTLPGKNWFAYFRLYGPEQAAFDGSWKLGDFEKIKS